jgi:hypothetical protein
MKDFVTGWEIVERWGIEPFQLLEYIRVRELTPYNKFGEVACRPDCEEHLKEKNRLLIKQRDLQHEMIIKRQKSIKNKEEYIKLQKEIDKLEKLIEEHDEKLFWHPYDWYMYYPQDEEGDPEAIISKICDLLFHINNVRRVQEADKLKPEILTLKKEDVEKIVDSMTRWPSKDSYVPDEEERSFFRQIKAEAKASIKPVKSKKVRLSQKHKEKVREVAAKTWQKDPTITIKDMIYENEINQACEQKAYHEKTIRNWIKDLCPDRKPGRRSKK